MKISLIIPAHNEENYIGDCLEHVLKNSNGKLAEIIVVDNWSDDKTSEVASRYPGVIVVREDEKGVSAARQAGFKASTGDILAFTDADTRMPPGWVEKIQEQFNANQELACLSGPCSYYDLSRVRNLATKPHWQIINAAGNITNSVVIGGNFAIRRSVLEKMGGFDTNIQFYGDDTDIGRRAGKFGTVKMDLSLVMPTSARRFKGQGFLKTTMLYSLNFFSQMTVHKSITKKHKDIR
jgi:glycosyltransferase involved in cell wall biosynthesis